MNSILSFYVRWRNITCWVEKSESLPASLILFLIVIPVPYYFILYWRYSSNLTFCGYNTVKLSFMIRCSSSSSLFVLHQYYSDIYLLPPNSYIWYLLRCFFGVVGYSSNISKFSFWSLYLFVNSEKMFLNALITGTPIEIQSS